MENMQAAHGERKNFGDLNLGDIAAHGAERGFNFKIRIIQTDLNADDDFAEYFHSLNNSSIPFMAQHSGYIEKLSRLNNFEGGTLAGKPGGNFERIGGWAFNADIANPEVLAEVARLRARAHRGAEPPAALVQDLLEMLLEAGEDSEWAFEDIDIPGNLYMFDMINGNDFEEDFEDSEYYDEDYEDEPDMGGHFEVKFDSTGSIRVLDGGMLELKYDESDMTGIDGAFVRFLFDSEQKDFVAIHRWGHGDTWLNCEKGKRVSSSGKSRGFGVTVETKEIVNNMTAQGGSLCVSYIRETNGVPSEMVTHIISASPMRK